MLEDGKIYHAFRCVVTPPFSDAGREKISGRVLLILIAITIYFVVLQLALRHYESSLTRDSVVVLERVVNWHQTGRYVTSSSKGYIVPPLALYCFRLPLYLHVPLEEGIRWVILLFGMSVPFLFFLLVREMCGSNNIALVSAALLASNPYFHDICNSIIRDPVFIPIALLTCYWILRSYTRSRFWVEVACAGIFSALAVLTRYEGVGFFGVFGVFSLLSLMRDRSWKHFFLKWLLFLICWICVVLFLLLLWGDGQYIWEVVRWRFSVVLR